MSAPRKFIVTIRETANLDVFDLQDAVVDTVRANDPGTQVDHGNTDVELVEVASDTPEPDGRHLVFRVLEGA